MKSFKEYIGEEKITDGFDKDGIYLFIDRNQFRIVKVINSEIKETLFHLTLARTMTLPMKMFLK